jgi:NADH-quinone oxidoreductase subunit N
MSDVMMQQLTALGPEIYLTGGIFFLIFAGLFGGARSNGLVMIGAIAILAVVAKFLGNIDPSRHIVLNGMFIDDGFARFVKYLILASSFIALAMAWPYLKAKGRAIFEYPILVLLAVLGMMLMVSAHNLLALYMGLELQSLALYVLAAFNRDDPKSSEAGMKYFVLGALSSGLLLFGSSLLYGMSGTLDFDGLQKFFAVNNTPLEAITALVFILGALAFKISAAPFHMWTPDVYEGAPTPVTAFFAAAPKVAALALLTRVLFTPLHGMEHNWQQVLMFLALGSMIIGGFAAIMQTSIKRLMAYSSIAHVGYALVGLTAGTPDGVQGMLVYLAIYFLNTLGVFGVILCLRRNGAAVDTIADLAGLSRSRPLLALAMTIFMFSLAGVPPLAGFYGKFYVFMAAINAKLYPLAIIGVLTSAVACFYYLRVIKLMYFDDLREPIDPVPEWALRAVVTVAAVYIVLFGLCPAVVMEQAQAATVGLFFNFSL